MHSIYHFLNLQNIPYYVNTDQPETTSMLLQLKGCNCVYMILLTPFRWVSLNVIRVRICMLYIRRLKKKMPYQLSYRFCMAVYNSRSFRFFILWYFSFKKENILTCVSLFSLFWNVKPVFIRRLGIFNSTKPNNH